MEKLYQIFPQELVTFVLVTLFSLLIGLSQRKMSLKKEGEGRKNILWNRPYIYVYRDSWLSSLYS